MCECPWLAASPGVWVAVNATANHNTHCPEQTIYIYTHARCHSILQLTWVLIVVWVLIKYTVHALNDQLSQMFTNHQRIISMWIC